MFEDPASKGPSLFKKGSKVKRPSALRRTLALEDEDEGDHSATIVRPKRPLVAQRLSSVSSRPQTPSSEKRSLYSTEYLSQLRGSTPSTPSAYVADDTAPEQAPDTISTDEALGQVNIPEEAFVRHIKQQREVRRQAGDDFIPLSESLSLTGRDKQDYGKRLQTEDDVDNIGHGDEGLIGFEDDRLPLSAKSTKAAQLHKKVEILELIDDVEGEYPYIPDDVFMEQSSDSDDEWERTQVRKLGGKLSRPATKPDNPVAAIPSLDQILAQLEGKLASAKIVLAEQQRVVAGIKEQYAGIATQEAMLQNNLNTVGQRFTQTIT